MSCTRRSVLRGLAAGTACSALGCRVDLDPGDMLADAPPAPDGGTCSVLACLSLGDKRNAALATVGGAVVVSSQAARDTLVVIRTSASAFVALSDVCTHRGCVMAYTPTSNLLVCGCHGSEFNLSGGVVRGPAVLPIKVYTATLVAATNTIDVT